MKSQLYYERTIKEMIVSRKGQFDEFLTPQLKVAAQCWRMVDKLNDEIMKSDMTTIEIGSMGQQKVVINPLLAQYDKQSRTLNLHFSALGLNFNLAPQKVNEAKADDSLSDPLRTLINAVNNVE